MDVVVGMPRDNITGKVVLFDSTLHNLLNITGEQIGSYFGYSLCVADINGDQLDDIVIGAPLYSGFEAKRGMYEEGRVYVIFQTNKHKFNGMIHLDGTRTKARFGLALCSVGDINRDGYQDFAVGAPYGGEHGNGAVYLYHGNSEGVDKEASQVIEPQDFGEEKKISTFGFSLSGGMDLDNNYYPDLLVGAYASDRVIHFRSRPIVNVTAKLEFSTEYISLEENKCNLKGETPVSCFEVTLCLEYTGIGVEQELAFLYELKLDSMKEDSRVFFLTEEIREKNVSIRLSKDSHYCTLSDYVFVQPKIRDKLTPITISLKYFLLDPHPASRRLKSIVSQDVPNEVSKRMNIKKNCGKDNECFPDLQLDVIPNMDKFVIEDKRRLELNVIISNAGEDAFEAMFYLDMPLDVNFIRINETKTEFSITCTGAQPETGMNELVCDIGNPLPVNASLQFKVLLEPSGIVSATDEFVFKVIINSSNAEFANRTFDNYREIHLPVRVEAELELHGESDPELVSYNKSDPVPVEKLTVDDIGPKITHSYKLINRGPSTVKQALVYILWPSYNLEKDPLLYLMDYPKIKGKNTKCEELIDDVNYLNIKKEETSHKKPPFVSIIDMRGKKDDPIDDEHPFPEIFERKRRKANHPISLLEEELNCGKSICTRIVCSVSNLKKEEKVVFTLNSRLWRETINKLGLEEVQISSKLVVAVTELYYSVDPASLPLKSTKVSTKVHLADVGLKSHDLPWWIIILAVCGGLLLLGLLALLLWKLGFFKRKRPQEEPEKVPLQKNGYQMARGDEAL